MSWDINVQGGTTVRLPTSGKYCDRDILVTGINSGVDLPSLSSPGTAADLMLGKQLIDGAGKVVDGSFTLASEMMAQDVLIEQIKTALKGKAAGGGTVNIEGLPAGYIRAGYIQFDDHIVDTKIVGNQDTKIKCLYTRETSASVYMYGCASSNNTAAITAYLGGNWRFGSKYLTVSPTTSDELVNTSIQSKTGVDRISASGSYSGVIDFETVGSILLGNARNASGTVPSTGAFTGKILLFEIYQGDELVYKLLPLVSLSGEYRLWDAVSKEFAVSLTGKSFTGGNL